VIAAGIRRGLVAGLLAGILAGVFALVVGHDPMAAAIHIEEAQHADHADDPAAQRHGDGEDSTDHHGSADDAHHDEHDHDDHGHDDHDEGDGHDDEATEDEDGDAHGEGDDDHEHLFSRTTQQALLPVATVVVGLGLGGLFGLAFALLRPRRRHPGDWQASLKLGAAVWSATVLLPSLTFPANPPGVGDVAGVDVRTRGYLLAVGVGLLAVTALYGLARRLATTSLRGPARQALVGATALILGAGLLAALPSALPGDGFPAELLWRFRLVSIGSQTLLWTGIAVGVGLLWERASHGGLTADRGVIR
jgi:hypothetical protein